MRSSLNMGINALNIPLGMISYVAREEIRKPFACYISMKFLFSGKFHESCLPQVMGEMGIKDKRTFKKYITELLKRRFLVYNPKSGYYFIRSFDGFRKLQQIKDRTSVILCYDQFTKLQAFIDTAMLGRLIQNQEYFWEKGKKRFKQPAYNERYYAKTVVEVDPTQKPAYYGLSNKRISGELNCSLSQACKRKRKAEKAEFLKTKKHFRLIRTLKQKDSSIRNYFYELDPAFSKKLRFRRVTNSEGEQRIELLQQLHDEIRPLITFSKRCRVKFTDQLYN